jgi:hypothetical protein
VSALARRPYDGAENSTPKAKATMPMTTVQEAAAYLLKVGGVTLLQLFALGGPALLLIALLSWLSGWVQRLAVATFGVTIYLLLFGWLGTTIHETGHLLTALLFRHQVASFRPFAPNLKTGVLGSVGTKYQPGSLYQYFGLFFIGIAPVVFGTLVIYLTLNVLFPGQMAEVWRTIDRRSALSGMGINDTLTAGLAFLGFVFSPQHLLNWRLYLFLYIAFSVGSSICLSREDQEGAATGCLPMVILLFLFNTVLLSLGGASSATFAWLTQYYTFLYILLCFVILLDVLAIAILWLPAMLLSL